jgi:hypothetical protein
MPVEQLNCARPKGGIAMTFQQEKLKIRYEHKLQVWRIVIEKALLGILLALGALAANVIMENYRSDLSRQRFLLESRLTALQALRESCSPLTNHTWRLAQDKKGTAEKLSLATYEEDLEKFMHLANMWNLLFSVRFNEAIERHFWTHQAMARGLCEVKPEHWPFLSDDFENFDHITRQELWEETRRIPCPVRDERFELEPWSFDELNKKGIKAFFDANLDKWRRWKTTAK